MTEWHDIPGYSGRYRIREDGAVLSLAQGSPRVMKPYLDSSGYLQTKLWAKGSRAGKNHKIHKLVALTFLADSYFEGAHVRHIDGNCLNNHVSNLAWGTRADNMQDRLRHGTNPAVNKTHCTHGHAFTPENTWYQGRWRQCLTCKRARNRRWMQQQRDRQAANG